MRNTDVYYIWERNDGYVSASCGYMPSDWTTTDGDRVTFKQLAEFREWKDAERYLRSILSKDRLTNTKSYDTLQI